MLVSARQKCSRVTISQFATLLNLMAFWCKSYTYWCRGSTEAGAVCEARQLKSSSMALDSTFPTFPHFRGRMWRLVGSFVIVRVIEMKALKALNILVWFYYSKVCCSFETTILKDTKFIKSISNHCWLSIEFMHNSWVYGSGFNR